MYNPFRKAGIVEKDVEIINSTHLQKITPKQALEKVNEIKKEKEQEKLRNLYSDFEVEKVWFEYIEPEIIRRTNEGSTCIGIWNNIPKNIDAQLAKYGKKLGWNTWLSSSDKLYISIK